MGQVAFNPNEDESPSIGKLRQILNNLDNYIEILGGIGDDLPLLESVQKMIEPIEEFVGNLEQLRGELEEDGEICEELHKTIMTIESDFEEEGILDELSMFIQDLRRWDQKERRGERSERKNVEKSRRIFRDYIANFKGQLKKAVDNRCYPDLRQAQ
jgi:hypothetical protein